MRMIVLLLTLTTTLPAQLNRSTAYVLQVADTVLAGFSGSSTSDISGSGDTLWFGTSLGLSATFDNGQSFVSFDPRYSEIRAGAVSGLAVQNDTIFVATAYDSTIAGEEYDTGGGISRSLDGGLSWEFLGQPMDSLRWTTNDDGEETAEVYSNIVVWGDTLLAVDVVTPINNPSYDLSFDGNRIWTASFAGGLRVSHDLGENWERVMLPWDGYDRLDSLTIVAARPDIQNDPEGFALDPVVHLNHRVFSVLAYGDTVWAGTAAGVNFSADQGRSWQRYDYTNSNITGNFVVALHRQQTSQGSVLWASTVTTREADYTGISYYDVNDGYWRAALTNERVYNFGASSDAIYVAGANGLFKSRDGQHYVRLPGIQHADDSDRIYSDAAYAAFVNTDGALWVGTGDGIAVSYDEGVTWRITKSRPEQTEDEFFAYPNPFTPRYDKVLNGQGNVLLRFEAELGESISISVMDFAMNTVRHIVEDQITPLSGTQERSWDGRNAAGYQVANGTYFVRLERGSDVLWTKVLVIN